jgi:hypothetical protein
MYKHLNRQAFSGRLYPALKSRPGSFVYPSFFSLEVHEEGGGAHGTQITTFSVGRQLM